jgi:hypothetical protein
MVESTLETGQIYQFNISAPLAAARQSASSWLSTIFFVFQVGFSESAHAIIRSVVVTASFTGKLCRTQIDIQSTENVSLYSNPSISFLLTPLQILLVRNNETDTFARYTPNRMNDVIYLPLGSYEGMTYWQFIGQEPPDPENTTSWHRNVNFTVVEDIALEVQVKLFVIRLDIDVSPNVLLRSIGIFFQEDFSYSIPQEIFGSTLFTPILDSFYIPGGVGTFRIYLNTWSALSPEMGWAWSPSQWLHISAETYLDDTNSSRNLQLSVVLPYMTASYTVLGPGDVVLFAVEGLLLLGFVMSMNRSLRHSDLRHRLTDSRLLPIVLLGLGIVLPWSVQLASFPNSSYDVVYWISWFSMPFMIRWTDSTPMQVLCSIADWWNASLFSTFLLFVPLFYACLSLASPETEGFDRTFALALFLPYLIVLNGFNHAVLSLDTISIGPLLILAALPIWLVRIVLRKLGVTK